MVKRPALALMFGLASALTCRAGDIDLRAWAASLPPRFSASGAKIEPTYMAAIDVVRDGDTVAVLGGAPAWAERSLEAVRIDADGEIAHTACPPGMACTGQPHPSGFLATASLIAAVRKGSLSGHAASQPYGPFAVVCVDAEKLAIPRPILDPCFELGSGAAITQRHRETGRFDGPILDPVTVRIEPIARTLSVNPKDKAS